MNYLIDKEYLTSVTNVSPQTDIKTIQVSVMGVTEYHIKRGFLGIPLYEVLDKHVNEATVLTPKQDALLQHVKYFMALRVEYDLLFNLVTIGNKGTTVEQSVASLELVRAKRQDVEAKAGHVKKTILEYLAANKADFPQFYPETPAQSTSTQSGYSFGIVFDNQPKRYIY